MMGYKFAIHRISHNLAVTHKFNARHLIKAGLNTDVMYAIQNDSVLPLVTDSVFLNRWDFKGASVLIQPFVQWKWRATENMDVTAGVHAQYYSLSNSFSGVEPRL